VAPGQTEPLNIEEFWRRFSRMVGKLIASHAHAEIVIIMQDGQIRQTRVNRSYRPADLPEV
jgi:hypothetical protein